MSMLLSSSCLAVAIVATGGAAPSCETQESGNTPSKDCGMSVANPHVSKTEAAKGNLWVLTKIKVACDHAPQSHVITGALEVDNNNQWVTKSVDERSDDRIPQPGKPETYYLTYKSCIPGVWRVTVRAKGVSASGIPFNWTEQRTATIPDDKCDQ